MISFSSFQPSRSDGFGTFDYFIELSINTLPNLLRFQLMDAIEKPLRGKLQEYADKINLESLIKSKMEEFQKNEKNLNKSEL